MISIITACLDAVGTIRDCVASVRLQEAACEHWVIDGGSSDGTRERLGELAWPGLHPLHEDGADIYAAMNSGLGRAGGDIIGFLNADDFYSGPEVLSRVARAFEDPSVDCCYGDLVYLRERAGALRVSRYWRAGAYERGALYQGWMPPHPTFFVRRRFVEQLGAYRPALGTAADYEFMLRYLLIGGLRPAYLPEILVCMRTGGVSNRTLGSRLKANRKDREAWRVNGVRARPWTLIAKPLRKLGQWVRRPPTEKGWKSWLEDGPLGDPGQG